MRCVWSDESLIIHVEIVLEILLGETLYGLIRHPHPVEFVKHSVCSDIKIDALLLVHLSEVSTNLGQRQRPHEVLYLVADLLFVLKRGDRRMDIFEEISFIHNRLDIFGKSRTEKVGGIIAGVVDGDFLVVVVVVSAWGKIVLIHAVFYKKAQISGATDYVSETCNDTPPIHAYTDKRDIPLFVT